MNQAVPRNQRSRSRLYRIPARGRIMGVCAGIADYFGISTLIVRIVAVLCLISFPVATLIAYLLAGLLLDGMPEHLFTSREEEAFWRGVRTDPATTRRPSRPQPPWRRRAVACRLSLVVFLAGCRPITYNTRKSFTIF